MIALLAATAMLAAQDWSVGQEREVDAGVYMRLVAEERGWRVWRAETRSALRCKAVKATRGGAEPAPIGVGAFMYGTSPFVEVRINPLTRRPESEWRGQWIGEPSVKYRFEGARFWEEPRSTTFDIAPLGERSIEVMVTTYQYPDINWGRSELTGVIDLAGREWAIAQVRACESRAAD